MAPLRGVLRGWCNRGGGTFQGVPNLGSCRLYEMKTGVTVAWSISSVNDISSVPLVGHSIELPASPLNVVCFFSTSLVPGVTLRIALPVVSVVNVPSTAIAFSYLHSLNLVGSASFVMSRMNVIFREASLQAPPRRVTLSSVPEAWRHHGVPLMTFSPSVPPPLVVKVMLPNP